MKNEAEFARATFAPTFEFKFESKLESVRVN